MRKMTNVFGHGTITRISISCRSRWTSLKLTMWLADTLLVPLQLLPLFNVHRHAPHKLECSLHWQGDRHAERRVYTCQNREINRSYVGQDRIELAMSRTLRLESHSTSYHARSICIGLWMIRPFCCYYVLWNHYPCSALVPLHITLHDGAMHTLKLSLYLFLRRSVTSFRYNNQYYWCTTDRHTSQVSRK